MRKTISEASGDDDFRHDGRNYTIDFLKWDDSASRVEFRLDVCLKPSEFISLQLGSRTFNSLNSAEETDADCEKIETTTKSLSSTHRATHCRRAQE